MYNPKISIVTVVYNDYEYIESTIKSTINQNYSNYEYIIIDGKSNDGTVDVVKRYESHIDYWISEKDDGIYDAMNKGIDAATGDWIIFMNCGDNFFSNNVLSDIFSIPINPEVKLLYGGCSVRSYWGDFTIKARPEGEIWKSFTHQSIFSRVKLNREYKFNLDYKAASDFDFVYTVFSKGYATKRLNIIVSDIQYVATGFSSVNEVLSLNEVVKSIILNRSNSCWSIRHLIYHVIALQRKYVSILIRMVSPSLINAIRKLRDVRKYD